MKEDYIDGITSDSVLEDEMFIEIIETVDNIDKTKYIEDVRRACKKVGRVKEFDNLLKEWKKKNALLESNSIRNVTNFIGQPLSLNAGDYIANDGGVKIVEYTSYGEQRIVIVCPHPIIPVERLVNIDDNTEKIKIGFKRDCKWKYITVDCNTIMNKQYISNLANRGIFVTSESAKDLVKYMSQMIMLNPDNIPLFDSISRLGWVGKDFAPYVENIKYDGDSDFQSIYDNVCSSGSYEVWLEHIKELRKDINIRLMLATSFASVLIEKVGTLPFITHLWGTTGFGKTVSLMVAASIWGNPEIGCLTRTMNMTANAMSRTSAFLYSIPFCADELQQIKSRWNNYDDLVMYLTEGMDKGKAKARGGIEEIKVWKNSYIFTGEEPITKSCSGGGVKNRVIEIEVKDKIIQDGNTTANIVKENYGHAGKKFVEYIQSIDAKTIKDDYKMLFTMIINGVDTTEKQAMSMALILQADIYACNAIFNDSSNLTIDDVKEYLISSKTVDITERAYEYTVNWIAENQIRFTNSDENRGAVWGKIACGVATVNKNVLMKALNDAGYDYLACNRKWGESGKLVKNSQGRYVHQTAVYNIKASYIKIVLDDMEEVADEVNPFEQESLEL